MKREMSMSQGFSKIYNLFITEMEHQVVEELLDTLAEKHIPKGKHKLLHVDSREVWKDLMVTLIESRLIQMKVSILTKCAISWEALLVQKLSIQN